VDRFSASGDLTRSRIARRLFTVTRAGDPLYPNPVASVPWAMYLNSGGKLRKGCGWYQQRATFV